EGAACRCSFPAVALCKSALLPPNDEVPSGILSTGILEKLSHLFRFEPPPLPRVSNVRLVFDAKDELKHVEDGERYGSDESLIVYDPGPGFESFFSLRGTTVFSF